MFWWWLCFVAKEVAFCLGEQSLSYYMGSSYLVFFMHMNRIGIYPSIVYASILLALLVLYEMCCTTWIGDLMFYILVQLCSSMKPHSCGISIRVLYVLTNYGMSFTGQPRVTKSNLTLFISCIHNFEIFKLIDFKERTHWPLQEECIKMIQSNLVLLHNWCIHFFFYVVLLLVLYSLHEF